MTSQSTPDDSLLAQVLSRGATDAADDAHLDDETLALFAAGGSEDETLETVVAHLSRCETCRRTASDLIAGENSAGVADLLSQSGSGDADTALKRGRLLLALGRIADAAAELQRAADLDPGNAQSHFALADAHLKQAASAQAELSLRRGLMIDKANIAAKARLAGVLEQLDRSDEARDIWNELLREKLSEAERSKAEAASRRLGRRK